MEMEEKSLVTMLNLSRILLSGRAGLARLVGKFMKLTAKQEAFCQAIAAGLNQTESFKAAYNTKNMAQKTIWEKASVLASRDKLKARIAELKEEVASKQLWTREQSVHALKSIVLSFMEKTSDRIAAIKELNLMHGYNEAASEDEKSAKPVKVTMVIENADD